MSTSVVNIPIFRMMAKGYYSVLPDGHEQDYAMRYAEYLQQRETSTTYEQPFRHLEIPQPRRLRIEADLAGLLALAAKEA